MSEAESGNKRIAKNTAILYIRMLIMMIISFFTARITLNALGVTDYGINNVVGGLVSMFSMISGSLSTAASRFITFGLGEGNQEKLKQVFSTTVNIHLILAIIVVIAIESIGVWFLNNKMNIPIDRLYAANWVLQCSVLSFIIGLLSVPYNSAIIAHEKMSAFAYMTIFDSAAKLIIILGIYYYGGDKLILLSILTVVIGCIRQSIYWLYCKRNFAECKYSFVWENKIGLSIFSFAGWNFIGSSAGLLKVHGVNIVINLFNGPIINAARGIAMQVNSMIGQFTGGFMTAITPQIIKSYAAGEIERMHNLIYQSTRLSFYLFMFLSIPVIFEIEIILSLWLGQIPEHSALFTRLVLINTLIEIISYTLVNAQLATGNIKYYQIVTGGIQLLNFPISYIFLSLGFFPEITVIVAIVISQIYLLAQLQFLQKSIKLPIRTFFQKVYLNLVKVTIISSILPLICHIYIQTDTLRFFLVCITSLFSSVLSIYYIGCSMKERKYIQQYIKKRFQKFCNNNRVNN